MKRDYRRGRNSMRNRRSYNNAYYNSSSVAYDYSEERVYYEPRRKQRIEKRKNQKKSKIQTVNEQTVHSFRVYFTALVLFSFSIFIIASNAVVTEQKSQISELKDELKQIEENNTYLQTELTKNLDLTEVEKQASIKLGMQKPSAYQIVYISVPQQSYTVKHENKEENDEKSRSFNFIESIKNILRID